MGIAIALTVLFGLMLVAANHSGWITATVLDTDRFVATFSPLPQDEAVSLALGQQVADGVIEQFEVAETIEEALPEGIGFIAVPLTSGVRDLTTSAATEVIRSDVFTSVWTGALTASHRIATAYVGALEDGVLVEQDGVAVIDLTPIAAQISENLSDRGFDLLEGSDRDLTIELFTLPDSGMIKWVADLLGSIRWVVFAATILLLVAAFAVATDRRRIAKWVGGAAVVAMLFALIELRYLKSAATGGIEDAVLKAGAESAWDIVFRQFVWQSWVVLFIGVLVIFVAWAFGDSASAVSLRSTVSNADRSIRSGVDPSPVYLFIARHKALIQVSSAVIGIGFLLLGPTLPLWGVILVIVLLGVILIGVEAVAGSVAIDEPVSESAG